ncbi:MAG: hypothetical protein ABIK73_06855 [candidate division WOR-3 bacterium]
MTKNETELIVELLRKHGVEETPENIHSLINAAQKQTNTKETEEKTMFKKETPFVLLYQLYLRNPQTFKHVFRAVRENMN